MQIHDEPTLGWTVVLRRQPVHLNVPHGPHAGRRQSLALVVNRLIDAYAQDAGRLEPWLGRHL